MSQEQSTNTLNDFSTKVKVINWVKTTRVQTAMVTALALWIGYVTVSPLTIQATILLGCIGLLTHIWGFTLNEVQDYEYDLRHGEAGGHPIAQGKVHAGTARYFAWMAGFGAIAISALSPYDIMATVVLAVSFIPGYMYDQWSKKHWWSNAYLSLWASLVVLSGALHAGQPNYFTALVIPAVGIQIFIQVVEGDLKDLMGPENTFAGKMGVSVEGVVGSLYDPESSDLDDKEVDPNHCKVVSYSTPFTAGMYLVKAVEVSLLSIVLLETVSFSADIITPFLAVFMASIIAFFYTLSIFMVYEHDRDRIKKMSSAHELTSIVVLGLAVSGLHLTGAVVIILAPILWYVVVNNTVHSSALNPDI